MSSLELNQKVAQISSAQDTATNYLVPKDVTQEIVIINNEGAHARTLVTEDNFRSFIRLVLRFLIDPKLQRKK